MTALAVQSHCFRHFKDNADVITRVKECGISAIEICGVHTDFSDESCFEAVIDTYTRANIQIVSIGVQGFKGEDARESAYFKFAKQAGLNLISADFQPESFPETILSVEKKAEQNGVNLAIHNHGSRHWLGSRQMLAEVFARTGPNIGLMLDTAWALDAKEDPVAMVEQFADRLYGIHIKDFVFDGAGKSQDVVVGTGNLDLPALFAKLKEVGFGGQLILEYEGDVENPVPALRECVEAVRKEIL